MREQNRTHFFRLPARPIGTLANAHARTALCVKLKKGAASEIAAQVKGLTATKSILPTTYRR